jgi:FKBP-type peptidyl-prolyl cis-trans isomerase FkpA
MTAVVLAAALTACTASPTSPATSAAFSQRDLRIGTGDDAASGKLLKVNYTGWLYNAAQPDQKGAKFDSSLDEGREPFSFTLGVGEVISGWDQGLVGMKVGGIRRLIVPPSLAYGGGRNGPIPPNATLVFEVELLEIPVETSPTQYTISVRTDAGNYFSVENNGNAAVLANRTAIADWETFRLFDVDAGALETGNVVRIETTSGWASSELGNTLAALASGQAFTQEDFVIERQRVVGNGSQIALRSSSTGRQR